MAHNARIRPDGFWTDGSVVDSVEFQLLDDAQYASVHEGGGTWAFTDQAIFGGDGLKMTGPLDLAGTCVVTGEEGVTFAGELTFIGDCAVAFVDTSFLLLNSGTSLTALSGSTVSLRGTVNYTGTAVVTIASGATVALNSGAALNLSGVTTLKTGGSLAVETGVTISSVGGALWQLGGAGLTATGTWTFTAATLAGTVTQSAAVTRTGSEVLSGSGATKRYRVLNAPDADTTLSTAYDYIRIPGALTTSPTVYKLEDTVPPEDGLTITISRVTTDIKNAQVRRETTNELIATFHGSDPSWVKVVSDGGTWHPVEWGVDDQTTGATNQGIADP